MDKFRILSLDGGGLRGVSTATILKKVEEIIGGPVHEKFNLIAGTSTGGIIASALGLGIKTDDILSIYLDRGGEIFPHHGDIEEKIIEAKNILEPKYSTRGIEKVLGDVLGDKKMSDLKTDILVPSFDLNTSKPLFFKSRNKEKFDFKIYDVCRATSAAPTYLPSYQFSGFNCIDGGVFNNNPAMSALAEVLKYPQEYKLQGGLENIYILSIGTGHFNKTISKEDSQHKGELFWAKNAPDLMMSGVSMVTDYHVNEIMQQGHYLRLNIEIEKECYSVIDDSRTETLNYLISETKKQITEDSKNVNYLTGFFQ